jgi:hypothetical protein
MVMQTLSTTKACHRDAQTHYRSSFFLLLVPMAGLEGELGTLLRVDMAGLPLFGVNFFEIALFFLAAG